MRTLDLSVLPGEYSIVRLDAGRDLPAWVGSSLAGAAGFVSVSRTPEEVSVVAPARSLPTGAPGGNGTEGQVSGGWRCLKVKGPIAFTQVGVLAAISGSLAGDGISLFAQSTFDTDYVLVQERDLARSVEALERAGHAVSGCGSGA